MASVLITNATLVNEGKIFKADVFIDNKVIVDIADDLKHLKADQVIDATGLHLLPGVIDDQVHFREPGLTHKGEIYTEAKAAVAGGITSFMEMPNTNPTTTTIEELEKKYSRASEVSLANYTFYMGATNSNVDEVLKINPKNVCGVKIFMGSSTGDMLVDNRETLENIFSKVSSIIAVHCEDDPMVKANNEAFKAKYGEENLTASQHHLIRSEEACYKSSSFAVELAKKHGTRLHILHISTAKELDLFQNNIPLEEKKITSEACIHHMWFSNEDYETKGNYIKWNPAVKTAKDRDAILQAVIDNRIDVIATDHAPHTIAEKEQMYSKAPSGGPLVQHSLIAMLDFYQKGKISLEKIVEKMSHNLAVLFRIENRGYIRKGYFADLVLVDLNKPYTVTTENILSKCGWSPFTGHTFNSSVIYTLVNGNIVYNNGVINEEVKGERLTFSVK